MTTAAISVSSAPAFDWRRTARIAALGALVCIFVALAGMPVGLDRRTLIEPVLSLGYLSLLWIPLLLGFLPGNETQLEGVEARSKGPTDVMAGATAGLGCGAGLGLLIVLLSNFDLRDPLVNWSPQLLDLLTFDGSAATGVLLWLAIGAGLGALGGVLHLMNATSRRVAVTVVAAVIAIAVLETVLTDLWENLGLEFLADFVYFKRGGLSGKGVALIVVVAMGWSLLARGRIGQIGEQVRSLEPPQRRQANLALLIGATVLLVVLPFFLGKIANELLANVGLFVLLALGLNIVVGLAGILDLGYVAFFAVGGYTTAVLTSSNTPSFGPELPWPIAVLVVIVISGLVGLFIGTPVIRMRGDYLAIVTLGFGEIIRLLFLSDHYSYLFGGAQGITNIPPADLGFAEVKGSDPRSVFLLVLFFCAIAVYVSWRLERSRLGRAWMAIREDETVAEAMGINTVNTKLMAFVVGAVLASFSGAVFAAKVGSIFPSSFEILVSIIILVVVIVGGMGNIAGVIAGAVVLIGVLGGPKQPGLLQEFSEFKLLIYGALLVWMMLKRPEGLVPNVRRTRELHQEEFLQDAWLKGEIDTGEDGAEAPRGGAST